jgi:hypothetical protein
MGQQATNDTKLPHSHWSRVTWIALATLAIVIALYVGWAVWFPSYSILPG